MKTFRLLFFVFAAALCVPLLPSCQTAPTARVQEVKTLKAVGIAVDGTMRLAAQLYHDGKINAVTWQQIADVHDKQFQPAFNLAVRAVQMNLDSVASSDLITLASSLSAILTPYLTPR